MTPFDPNSAARPSLCKDGLSVNPEAPKRVAIGIASAGRPQTLQETVEYLLALDFPAARIIVSVPTMDDAPDLYGRRDVELIVGSRGLTAQRNRILSAARGDSDIVIFFDDDFIPSQSFIACMVTVFERNPDVVIATGQVVADGIIGPGLTMKDALAILATPLSTVVTISDVYNAYGCNMGVRLEPVFRQSVCFDENLPLYGWLEDVDFSRSIARFGRSVQVAGATGVHLGTKSGRQAGRRLGYSQIANPAYLARKGTMSKMRAFNQLGRNIAANICGVFCRDPGIDRKGRLAGNLLAIIDLAQGRAHPLRILDQQMGSAPRAPPSTAPNRGGS